MRQALTLCLALVAACATAPPPEVPPTATQPPAAERTPIPTSPARGTPVPTPTAPPAAPTDDLAPPLVRVLLERANGPVELPQPGRRWRVLSIGSSLELSGPLSLSPAAATAWQVGAWRDPGSADTAVARLGSILGDAASVRSVRGEDGLVRVQVSWATPPMDVPGLLARSGFAGAYPVRSSGAVRVDGAGGQVVLVPGEALLLADGDWPLAVGGKRYRGRLRARVDGSALLLINEVGLEAYLRGVVPAEMGPYQFPELEALKAQAVAARTYAVAHLGDHDEEGYDICDTAACQVYAGFAVEHSLTDRAVAETSGLVATYDGRPIDAMYTSTCSGHTEDAAFIFPDRTQPYLRGVPCAWDRELALSGQPADDLRVVDPPGFRAEVARTVLGLGSGVGPEEVVQAVTRRVDGVARSGALTGWGAVASALLAAAGLEEASLQLVRGDDPLERLLALADLFEIPLDPPLSGDTPAAWALEAAYGVLVLSGVLDVDAGEAVPHPEGVAIYPARADRADPLSPPVPLWVRWGGSYRRSPAELLRPGTRLERVRADGDLAALVIVRSGGGGDADRRSAWRSWVRERSLTELARMVGITDLERIEVTARSPSGRVIGVVARGRSGATKEWSGFPVRRALDLPENLFTVHRVTLADGVPGYRFLGRAWGHGVGLCQNGAYGLARAGRRFDDILRTYYTGITVEPLQSLVAGTQ